MKFRFWHIPEDYFGGTVSGILLVLLVVSSCARIQSDSSGTGGTGGGGGGGTTTGPTIFGVALLTAWESAPQDFVKHGDCSVPSTTNKGATVTCNISVPEAQLFYSQLKFDLTISSSDGCEIMIFDPYYYRRSTSAAYVLPGTTTSIDCSAAKKREDRDANCYGGAGKEIVTAFPKNIGTYFLPAQLLSKSWTLSSSNTRRQTFAADGSSNRWVSNKNSTPTTPGTFSSEDYSGEMNDWRFSCQNKYGETLYNLVIFIDDIENAPGEPQNNNFDSWP